MPAASVVLLGTSHVCRDTAGPCRRISPGANVCMRTTTARVTTAIRDAICRAFIGAASVKLCTGVQKITERAEKTGSHGGTEERRTTERHGIHVARSADTGATSVFSVAPFL